MGIPAIHQDQKYKDQSSASRCAICGGDRWTFVRHARDLCQPHDHTTFTLDRCLSCGQIMQNPPPTPAQLSKAYSREYAPYQPAWKQAGWPLWKILRQLTTWRRMRRLKRYAKGSQLLEVGSGAGDFLYAAHRAGWSVKAVEYSESAAAALRTELGFDVRAGDLTRGLWPDGGFDVAVLWSVLEHLQSPLEALTTVCSYLRKGGVALIQIPTIYGVQQGKGFGEYWALLELPRHLSFLGKECLSEILDKAGMDLVLFETPLLETAWCHYASICNYANYSVNRPAMGVVPLAMRSVLSFPGMALRAWRGKGTEAFAVAVKR